MSDMSNYKRKTVHYLQYTIHHTDSYKSGVTYVEKTFEEYLEEAITLMANENSIEMPITTEGKKIALSLYKKALIRLNGCVTGELYVTQAGKKIAAEAREEEGCHIVPAQPYIPQNTNKNGESASNFRTADPAEQVTYFAISGNHVAYCSDSSSARSKMLMFFEYLFKTKTHILPTESIIHEETDIFVDPKLELEHKGLSCIRYSFSNNGAADDLDVQIQGIINNKIPGNGISKIQNSAILQELTTKLTISLGRKNRGMKMETLKKLLCSMSESELAKTLVIFSDGHKMQGTMFRPDSKINVLHDSDVPVSSDAQKKLSTWLNEFISRR